MPKNKVFKTIKVEEKSFSQLSFICDRLGKKKSIFMKELLENLFDIFSDLKPKTANIFYLPTGNKLIINAVGQSYLITGTFPMPTEATPEQVDSEVKRLCEETFSKDYEEKEKVKKNG